MNKQALTQFWDHFRQVYGMSLRVIEGLPADKLDSHPIPNMRTPKELVIHSHGFIKSIGEGVIKGEIQAEPDEKKTAASIKSRDELLKYARDCWKTADQAVARVTDQQLQATVKTPWDVEFPGHVCFTIAQDEFLHHRGQMFTYLRALGGEPPMMWDFENNAAEYRPKAQAKA